MNNNIGNMGGANPQGFNPINPIPPIQECQGPQCPQNDTPNADPLKFVPGDQYGRAMVGQNTNSLPPQVNPQNVRDDIFTFQLVREFGEELMQGYMQRGIDPQRAQYLADLTLNVLLNPQTPQQNNINH